MKRDFNNTLTEEFAEGASRAFWVDSWASTQEEKGKKFRHGVSLEDQAPATPLSAWVAAGELIGKLEAGNRASIHTLAERAVKAELRNFAAFADGEQFIDVKEFGWYLAMQSLGHGVSWFDNHEKFEIKIPHMEYHAGSQFGR